MGFYLFVCFLSFGLLKDLIGCNVEKDHEGPGAAAIVLSQVRGSGSLDQGGSRGGIKERKFVQINADNILNEL